MPTVPLLRRIPWPALAAFSALLLWAAVLFSPALQSAAAPPARALQVAASLWHLLSFYLWYVPAWRRHVIERRGPLLGVGFAFGAAFVSTLADASASWRWSLVALFFWRLAVYLVPFVPPLVRRLPPRPHPVDGAVVVLALLLSRIPGFDGAWFAWEGAHPGGLLGGGIGPGSLGAPALLATYFYGVRPWTGAPLDLKARPGDGRSAALAVLLAVAGGAAGLLVAGIPPEGAPAGGWELAGWLLLGLGLSALFEELAFRGIFQAGLSKMLLSGRTGLKAAAARLCAALAAAALHGVYGPFGMPRLAGFGFSLGIGWVFAVSNRYFPAALAHGLGLVASWALARLAG